MTAYHLAIGLNEISTAVYGDDGRLFGCIADARDMLDITRAAGFGHAAWLLDEDATLANVRRSVSDLAGAAQPGDLVLVSYSGHGTRVRDVSGDEASRFGVMGRDSALVLYDGLLLDDEVHSLLALFRPGVRVVLIADCCHAGTIHRVFAEAGIALPPLRYRALPTEIAERALSTGVEPAADGYEGEVRCALVLMAAAQDWQTASDGGGPTPNGLFTWQLKETFRAGPASWRDLFEATRAGVVRHSGGAQIPNLVPSGPGSRLLAGSRPFAVAA